MHISLRSAFGVRRSMVGTFGAQRLALSARSMLGARRSAPGTRRFRVFGALGRPLLGKRRSTIEYKDPVWPNPNENRHKDTLHGDDIVSFGQS